MNRVATAVGGKLLLAMFILARHPATALEHSPVASDSGATNRSLIDLPSALRLAGAQNLDIQIARERLNEARANHDSALEQFFPWISPGISYHRRDGLAQAVPAGTVSRADFESYSPGGTIGAQMDIGDAIYKSLASKRVSQSLDNALEAQRQDSTLSAAQGYFELAKAKALVNANKEAMETSQEYQDELHEAVAAGIAFRGDELRVQTETDGYRIAVRRALEQQRIAAVRLAEVLHLDQVVELVPRDDGLAALALIETNAPLDALVQSALRSRPELLQSRSLVAASRDAKNGSVYGPLIPSVGAQVFMGGFGGGPDGGPDRFGPSKDYLVGLSWRIGPGGLFDRGRVQAGKARLSAAELEQAKLKDTVIAQVIADAARVQSLSDQLELMRRKLAAASETLRLTRERKQFGVGNVLEDIQAQQALTQARSQYITAIAEFNASQYELAKAAGGLPESQGR